MFKYEQGTPCPSSLAQHTDIFSPPIFVDNGKQTSATANKFTNASSTKTNATNNVMDKVFDDFNDNTTRNIAKLMRDEFKNARLGMPQKPRRNNHVHAHAVGIFEDGGSAAQLDVRRLEKEGGGLMGAGAIRARRPQKIKIGTARDATLQSTNHNDSVMDIPAANYGLDENSLQEEKTANLGVVKDSRRRTIWVPSDDTTVLSIHPGAYDQTLRDDTIGLPPQRSLSSKTTKPNVSYQPNKSSRQPLAAAPKRAPLRALAPVQPNASLDDRAKCFNGKENIPPSGSSFKNQSEKAATKLDLKPIKQLTQPLSKPVQSTRTSLLREQTAASQVKVSSVKKRSVPEPKEEPRKVKAPLTKDPRPRTSTENPTSLKLREHIANARASKNRSSLERQAPSKLSTPNFKPRISANLSRYPVLTDDLVQPELYEDNWLTHQEAALTQLINGVFQQADSTSTLAHDNVLSLRGSILRSYQDSSVVTLHKRIKASLIYGALSMPKATKELPRLREDVGLRRQFLDLWVQSYNLDALQAAAEAVVGRAMTSKPRDAASIALSLGTSSGTSVSAQERELRRFLLAFLVHHEDAIDVSAEHQKQSHLSDTTEEHSLRTGSPEWFWQRTVLSSFMLIKLLDSAKTSGIVSGCLFQVSSIRKSSNSILHALTRMLLPWIGDVTRPLGYLNYAVPHNQLPLSEYSYRICNIATDLRNGVLLTRFVELLLYPPSSLQTQPDQTLTLSLPDGETLTSSFGVGQEETRLLSQHLKFPSVGRAQKLHNVQIALSALQGVQGSLTEAAISSTRAEDIVDGHREKTLSLLWSLVSKWGLGMIVDWEELKRETKRFAADSLAFDSSLYLDESVLDEEAAQQPDAHAQATLLKAWASSICTPNNITITNLTTSFASGQALACIVAAYSEFLSSSPLSINHNKPRRPAGSSLTTADALRALGCSESFTSLFASSSSASTLPCRSTTTALLAFLASRLLPLARSHRAAKTLQRAWRLVLAKREITKRVRCMVLARECVTVVEMKMEFEDAAVVLQRAWRGVVAARRQAAFEHALGLQRLARGWAVRRRLKKGRVFSGGSTGGSGRVMGGW